MQGHLIYTPPPTSLKLAKKLSIWIFHKLYKDLLFKNFSNHSGTPYMNNWPYFLEDTLYDGIIPDIKSGTRTPGM